MFIDGMMDFHGTVFRMGQSSWTERSDVGLNAKADGADAGGLMSYLSFLSRFIIVPVNLSSPASPSVY